MKILLLITIWINLKQGFVVVPVVGQDKHGIYHSMEMISSFNYLDKMSLKEAILSAINIGNPKVKALSRDEYPTKPELFKYLKCNSQKQVDRECTSISVSFINNEIHIIPSIRLYPRGSKGDLENKIVLKNSDNYDELFDNVHNLIVKKYSEFHDKWLN